MSTHMMKRPILKDEDIKTIHAIQDYKAVGPGTTHADMMWHEGRKQLVEQIIEWFKCPN